MHTHIVFFWLKDPKNADHRETFAAGLKHLLADPNVLASKIGEPAKTDRSVVESGYDFAITADFQNLSSHDAYQAGQNHTDFLDRCQVLWSRVQVYDLES